MTTSVDHAEIKTGQLLTIAIAALSIYLNEERILIGLGVVFLLTALVRPLSPFGLVYKALLRPLKVMSSDYRLDNMQAHNFGQLIGALTVAVAVVLMMQGYELAGWAVVWVLIGLTATSYLGWCVGCFLYYQINRMGLNGFFGHRATDQASSIGKRPQKKSPP